MATMKNVKIKVMRMTMAAAMVCAAGMRVAAAPAPRWISGDSADPAKPAPVLVKDFSLDAKPEKAVFSVAVAGWREVYVNGAKVGNDVLSPVTCQPDERVSSLDFDVADLLKNGTNTLEVLLGNGWQNTFTTDAWYFAFDRKGQTLPYMSYYICLTLTRRMW